MRQGSTDILKLLLGVHVSAEREASNGATAVHMAADEGQLEVLQTLVLRKHMDVNAKTKDTLQRTPLHFAAAQGNAQCVEFLLSAGADPEIKDNRGMKPVQYAVPGVVPAFRDSLVLQLFSAVTDSEVCPPEGPLGHTHHLILLPSCSRVQRCRPPPPPHGAQPVTQPPPPLFPLPLSNGI